MCSRASCPGDPFCSVWRCCSPEVMEASAPTKKKSPAKRRFTSPVSPGKMGTICKGVVPSNTKKATSWAVRVFEEWRRERNATATGEVPIRAVGALQQRHTEQNGSPRQDALEHISRPRSSTHVKEVVSVPDPHVTPARKRVWEL